MGLDAVANFHSSSITRQLSAESLRSSGLISPANAAFSSLIADVTAFLECSSSEAEGSDCGCEEEVDYLVSELVRLRSVAAYQLMLGMLQVGDGTGGDRVAWRLGFVTRLSERALMYDGGRAAAAAAAPARTRAARPLILDGVLEPAALGAAKDAFGEGAPFWKAHGYPTREFFSYNVALSGAAGAAEGGTVIHAVVDAVRSAVEGSGRFPRLGGCTSAEVWCHARSADGHHQFHYDLDEVELRDTGVTRSPAVSCVLCLEVCGGGGEGAPTVVTDRVLGGEGCEGCGWLCFPKVNRLTAFDGRLLHSVVPGKPREGGGGRRVTFMVGFWEDGLRRHEGGESGLGPNMPLPVNSAWLESMKCNSKVLGRAGVVTDSSDEAEFIDPIWSDVEVGEEDKAAFEEYHDIDVGFTGRFFLRSKSAGEIDAEVLSGAGGGGGLGDDDDDDDDDDEEDEEDEEEEDACTREQGNKKRKVDG